LLWHGIIRAAQAEQESRSTGQQAAAKVTEMNIAV